MCKVASTGVSRQYQATQHRKIGIQSIGGPFYGRNEAEHELGAKVSQRFVGLVEHRFAKANAGSDSSNLAEQLRRRNLTGHL